jgi:predicted dithiol-disulfide oxidoreductase (DUF899 family)
MRHEVVSREDWLSRRLEFLAKEKEFSKLRDQISAERRALPYVKVEKEYIFEGPAGKVSLGQLFGTHSQLFVYHFMYGPDWERGCAACSFWSDHFDGPLPHLAQRDVSFVAISRASVGQIAAFKERMGWTFPWVSSGSNSFNYDFYASFTDEEVANKSAFYNFRRGDPYVEDREGASTFLKGEDGSLYHAYSTFARGIDTLNGTYNILDLCPLGRNESGSEPTDWVRLKDEY